MYNIKKIISRKPRIGLLFPHFNIAPPKPLFLLVHITLKCNKICGWCYETSDSFYRTAAVNEMPAESFQKVLSGFKGLKPHLHIFGGEPLHHPEFPLFLEYCRESAYRPTLTTNGDYLDKYGKLIINSTVSQINISLNTLIDNKGNFNTVFREKIREFVKSNKRKKTVNFNYVIEPGTYAQIEKVALCLNDTFKKNDFFALTLQHLNSTNIPGEDFDIKKLAGVLNKAKKTGLGRKILFLPDIKMPHIENYYMTGYAFKNKCYVPWLGLSIYPDLTVTPGGGILACNHPLGNLNQTAIADIWKGARLKDFRLKLIREGLPGECNRCCQKLYY